MSKRKASRPVTLTDAERYESDHSIMERIIKQGELLGLIERHGWIVGPAVVESNAWEVETHTCFHSGETLIEALTAAASCDRCTGRET